MDELIAPDYNMVRDEKHLLALRLAITEQNISDQEMIKRVKKYTNFKDWFETYYNIIID